jgi:hypothetical protein
LELVVSEPRRVWLSIPALANGEARLDQKDLLSAGRKAAEGKFTLEEHLAHLEDREGLPRDRPLLAFGLRNNLVNLRAMVLRGGKLWAAEPERPQQSRRPYHGLGLREGRFVVESILGGASDGEGLDFLCAGVPVVWDDLSEEDLFDLFLTEAADHSHVFELPRGNHPLATDATRGAWQALHDTFLEHLYSEVPEAAAALRATAEALDFPLTRATDYLHSVLGVDAEGRLVNVVANGRLEDLGHLARQLGCERAVCVENSGSVMPTYLPKGTAGPLIPLLRAPNFRPWGRALLVVEVGEDSFAALGG